MNSLPVRHPRVVVGVDGSPSSDRAVDWAGEYARRTGALVELVTAWSYPMSYGMPMVTSAYDPEDDARATVEKAVARLHLPPELVRTQVVNGPAPVVLIAHAADADLLVVGSRGHGGFAGLLLGSVSAHCVHHATCPVVVVR